MDKKSILSENYIIGAKDICKHELKIFNSLLMPFKKNFVNDATMFSRVHNAIYSGILAPYNDFDASLHITEDLKKKHNIARSNVFVDSLSPFDLRLYAIALFRCSKALTVAAGMSAIPSDYIVRVCNDIAKTTARENLLLDAKGDFDKALLGTSFSDKTKAILKNRVMVKRNLDAKLEGKKYCLKSDTSKKNLYRECFTKRFSDLKNLLTYAGFSDKDKRVLIFQAIDCGFYQTSYFKANNLNIYKVINNNISLSEDDYFVNMKKLDDAYTVLKDAIVGRNRPPFSVIVRLAQQSGNDTRNELNNYGLSPDCLASFVYLCNYKDILPNQ